MTKISEKEGEGNDLYDPNFKHLIFGMTSKTKIDPRDHISLFKIIELRNGTGVVFEYALNIVKTKIGPR